MYFELSEFELSCNPLILSDNIYNDFLVSKLKKELVALVFMIFLQQMIYIPPISLVLCLVDIRNYLCATIIFNKWFSIVFNK